MSEPDYSHQPNIQNFLQWARSAYIPSAVRRSIDSKAQPCFIPLRQVTEYFADLKRLKDMLGELFSVDDIPVNPETVQEHYARAFCILLLIGKGCFIERFVEHDELKDERLPFLNTPECFPLSTVNGDLFQLFYDQQWVFCAHTFRYRSSVEIPKQSILPFMEYKRCGSGGSADIHKVGLQKDYNQLNPLKRIEGNFGATFANAFVIKRYKSENAKKYYECEKAAYRKLSSEHLIGFFGSFVYDGTYNLILEYANHGSLEDYFQKVTPPSSKDDIVAFWGGMFGPVAALAKVHSGGSGEDKGSPPISQGWHQDVKPANILVVSLKDNSPYAYQFKLGDLGLSHFMKVSSREAYSSDTNGTRTYGAPECYRSDDVIATMPLLVKQSVDIWSIGCILCEAAVWVMLDKDGLEAYRRCRQEAINQIPGFRDSDCFHDGQKALDCALGFPRKILGEKRKRECDAITEPLLEIMAEALDSDPDLRPTSKQLWGRLQKILSNSKRHMPSRNQTAPPILQSTMAVNSGSPPKTPPRQYPSSRHSELPILSGANGQGPSRSSTRTRLPESEFQSPKDPPGFGDIPMRREQSPDGSPNTGSPDTHRSVARRSTGAPHRMSTVSANNIHTSKLPFLSIDRAQDWKNSMKNYKRFTTSLRGSKNRGRPKLPGEEFLRSIEKRDLAFIIDDVLSMKPYWEKVCTLFSLLAYIVKESDPDGVELFFPSRKKGHKHKNTSELSEILRERHADKFPKTSDMEKCLEMLFRRYQDDFDKQNCSQSFFSRMSTSSRKEDRITLYIFTNGDWHPDSDVAELIKSFVGELRGRDIKPGKVGIQFITFGVRDHTEKGALFDYLDSGLSTDREDDFVDAEPSDGNVLKMLVGSTNKFFDDDHDDKAFINSNPAQFLRMGGENSLFVSSPTRLEDTPEQDD